MSQKFLKLQQSGESLVPRHPRQVRTVEGVPCERLAVGTAMGLVALLGQATLALFVVYFFSPSPANYRRKIVRLFRHKPKGEDKVLTVIEQIHHDVEKYMLNRVMLNAILSPHDAKRSRSHRSQNARFVAARRSRFAFSPSAFAPSH